MSHSRTQKFVVIGLVAASMLMYEILLTRICSLRLLFHFAFLIIGNSLLGIAASGSLITLYQEEWKKREDSLLPLFCGIYCITLVGVYAALLNYPLPSQLAFSELSSFISFSTFNLIGSLPFFLGWLIIGMLLSFNADSVNRLYAVDLIGASIGCFLTPFFMAWWGAGGVQVVVVMLGILATLACATGQWRKVALPVGIVGILLGLWLLPTLDASYPLPSKEQIKLAEDVNANTRGQKIFSSWSTNSRIDLMPENPQGGRYIFSRGTRRQGLPPIPEQHLILQDANAGTMITNFSEHPEALEILENSLYSAAIQLKSEPRVFIIGAGGGNDLWAAKAAGASAIMAIELNAPILKIHREILPHFSKELIEDPRVKIVIDEGRSALMQDTSLYDVVQMTGIDTWTALASGAYVLAENYLYTREALLAMHDHLAEGGIIQIIRFAQQMESLRIVSNVQAAFDVLGRKDLAESFIALSTPDGLMAFLIKKEPYTLEEIGQIVKFSDESGIGRVYVPGSNSGSLVEKFIRTDDKAAFVDGFPRDITPTTDDLPYFFNFTKWSSPFESRQYIREPTVVSQGNPLFILGQLGLSIVLSALLILLPIVTLRGLPHKGAGRYLIYFAGLGLGFILVEITALQKLTLFLGHPVYSITVTLACILFFTGLGSLLLAGRFRTLDRRIWIVPMGIALVLAAVIFLSPMLVKNLIGLSLPFRIAISVAVLAPIGLLLGIPFAYGVRVLDERAPALIPWGWAINGCFSVVGSILAVVISMNFGFNIVLVVAALVYTGGFWALWSEVSS